MRFSVFNPFLSALLAVVLLGGNAGAVERPALKALFIAGGGYHDYDRLVPHLTTNLSVLLHVTFALKFDLATLNSLHSADAYLVAASDVSFAQPARTRLDNTV